MLFCRNAAAITMEEIAGTYVGKRIQTLQVPGKDVIVFDEVAIYQPDGSYFIWLKAKSGEVYTLEGYVEFDSNGDWSESTGPQFHATYHGRNLIAFVDWGTVGQSGVVHSLVHRVDRIPDRLLD